MPKYIVFYGGDYIYIEGNIKIERVNKPWKQSPEWIPVDDVSNPKEIEMFGKTWVIKKEKK